MFGDIEIESYTVHELNPSQIASVRMAQGVRARTARQPRVTLDKLVNMFVAS